MFIRSSCYSTRQIELKVVATNNICYRQYFYVMSTTDRSLHYLKAVVLKLDGADFGGQRITLCGTRPKSFYKCTAPQFTATLIKQCFASRQSDCEDGKSA